MTDPSRPRVMQLTPPGRGAIATLLVEGPTAAGVVASGFRPAGGRPLGSWPAGRIVFGQFRVGDRPGEDVVVCRRSDESVELHCHGGHVAVARIREGLIAAGCRAMAWEEWAAQAEPDPIAAAARIALAHARTPRTAAVLLDQYHGALRRAVESIDRALARGGRKAAAEQIGRLLARADAGRHLTEPWRVILAGAPNVGKSSLINALVGYQRAVVQPKPGTTRDVVSATTAIAGWPVELADTAGIRESDEPVERAAVELARRRLASADLVLVVFDASQAWSGADRELAASWPDALVIHNKSDLVVCRAADRESGGTGVWPVDRRQHGRDARATDQMPVDRPPAPALGPPRPEGLWTSALLGEGIGELIRAVGDRLVPNPPAPGDALPFTPDQVDALGRAADALARNDVPCARSALGPLLPAAGRVG